MGQGKEEKRKSSRRKKRGKWAKFECDTAENLRALQNEGGTILTHHSPATLVQRGEGGEKGGVGGIHPTHSGIDQARKRG